MKNDQKIKYNLCQFYCYMLAWQLLLLFVHWI